MSNALSANECHLRREPASARRSEPGLRGWRSAPVAHCELRLCVRLHAVDALHFAVQLHDAADLQLRRPEALFRSLVQCALEDRLRQSFLFQRLLCRPLACGRSRARHRHRPARAGRSDMAHDLSLSARRLVRGHRHGVELALQPRRRHRVFRAQPWLARFHFPPDDQPRHRDLRHHRHRRSGSPPASRWPCFWPACARSTPISSRRRRSTAPARRASIARSSCRRSRPIFVAVVGRAAAIRDQDLRSRRRADQRRPGHRDDLSRRTTSTISCSSAARSRSARRPRS